jgi:DNA-binding MarR family transcriptional regulator
MKELLKIHPDIKVLQKRSNGGESDLRLVFHERVPGVAELFDNSKGKEKEDKKKELTPEEKYFRKTSEGQVLDLLEQKFSLDQIRTMKRRGGTWGIKTLKKGGVIEESESGVKIYPDKLKNLFKETTGAQVLNSYKKNPEISPTGISDDLKISVVSVYNQIDKLLGAGFIEMTKSNNKKIISLTKYSKELSFLSEEPGVEMSDPKTVKLSDKENRLRIKEIDNKILVLLRDTPLNEDDIFKKLKEDSYSLSIIGRRIYHLSRIGDIKRTKRLREGKWLITDELVQKEENNDTSNLK